MKIDRIRIVIADDHAILRAGLRSLLNAQPDMEVVGVSTSCKCISASTETKVLKPHEQGQIKLVLDTSRSQNLHNA